MTRPPGIRLDSGGCGKGLAADLVAGIFSQLLEPGTAYIVDCGGDMRVGELDRAVRRLRNPSRPEAGRARAARADPAIAARSPPQESATGSGATEDGFAHHLIDPGTGKPAWTGVASATALGPTALIAESIAKVALLSGPEAAREVLARHGGVLVEFDGTVTQLDAART